VTWDWEYAWEVTPKLLDGLVITIEATLIGMVIALVVGLLLAIGRRSRHKALARPAGWFVEVIRSTPLLIQLYALFYVLPELGVTLSPMVAGLTGLGLHYSTYTSEVYRAGIEGVPRGQWEAAVALNLPASRIWRSVIIPQAVPKVLPALANYAISMLKDTPLLSVITVTEMLGTARALGSQSFRYLEPITLVGVFFLLLSLPLSHFTRWLEARFGH
jgi:polar amino acid transport system permease protein